MIRSFMIALCLATCLVATVPSGLAAANPLASLTSAIGSSSKAAPSPGLTDAQINAAIATLNNPSQRNALIATLQAMKANAPPKKKTTTPASVGHDLLAAAGHKIRFVLTDLGHALREATNVSLLWHWMVFVATDMALRHTIARTIWRLAIVLGTALVGEYGTIVALRWPRAAILRRAGAIRAARRAAQDAGLAAAEAGQTERLPRQRSLRHWFRRLPFALGHFLLALVPALVFALIGLAWLSGTFADDRVARLVIIAVLEAYLVCRLVLEVARLLLAPDAAAIRLVRANDHQAEWLVTWLRRLIGVIAFGYAAIVTGGVFGLYHAASQVFIKLVSLIVHVMLAIMVLQARRPVAAIIRGKQTGSGSFLSALRAGLARSWHILALFYIVVLWVVWAIGVPHAMFTMLRIVVVVAIVITVARGIADMLGTGLNTVFDDGVAWRTQYPGFHTRARIYLPVLKLAISTIIGVIAVLVIVQLWGFGVLTWIAGTRPGQHLLSATITIGVVVLIALIVWEAANAGMEGHADRLVNQGRPGRAARYRTLLPMLRSTLLGIILMIAGLVVLSAVGVNVTLLLGGLSIFGLAVGFGSQKLVQDIITGLFLLLEDAVQVGDWVTLGGISGTVEKLSIRTIRLRAGDGALNVIPFSAVSTVANYSREFSFAPISVGVAYKEDIDRVFDLIRAEFEAMRAEPDWAPQILGELELWGLDKFGASSLDIVGRMRTPAGKQNGVRREFNRRLKIRFDAEGVEIPFSYQRITIDPAEFQAAFARPEPLRAPPAPADAAPASGSANG